MRIVMEYGWKGIIGGSAGIVKSVKRGTVRGSTILTVVFDYGETREVPKVATILETVWINRSMTSKD